MDFKIYFIHIETKSIIKEQYVNGFTQGDDIVLEGKIFKKVNDHFRYLVNEKGVMAVSLDVYLDNRSEIIDKVYQIIDEVLK